MPTDNFTLGATRRAHYHRLRRKDDTTVADTTTWYTDHVDPNSMQWTVGGTASNGAYTVTATAASSGDQVQFGHTRSGSESNTDIATGMVTDINTRLADSDDDLSTYVQIASSSAAVVTVIVSPTAPMFTVGASAAGSGSLSVAPDDTWPITKVYSPIRPDSVGKASALEIFCIQVDSSDVPLANGTAAVDLTVLQAVPRRFRSDSASDSRQVAVTQATTESGLLMGVPVRIPFNGGRVGVHLSAVTNPTGSIDALEVWCREAFE